MKRLLTVLICTLILITPFMGSRADSENGFEYTITNGEVTITRYSGTAVGLSIPSTLGGIRVTAIAERAFLDCTTIKTITVSEGLESIGAFAFERCFGLETVILPSSVTAIGEGAFRYCYKLKGISVSGDNPTFSTSDGILFNRDGSVLIQYPTGSTQKEYTVGGTVREIGDWAFNSCSLIERVVISRGVIIIGDSAFSSCGSLSEAVFPTGITTLGDWSFSACEKLTSPNLPSTLEYIGEGAFYYCILFDTITLPRSLKSLGQRAFSDCAELQSVYFEGNMPNRADETTFSNCHEDLNLFYHVDRQGSWSPDGETEQLGLPIQPYGTHIFIRGDADSSGEVNAADASHILRNVVKLVPDSEIDKTAADVDNSGSVTAADASIILRYIVRLIASL